MSTVVDLGTLDHRLAGLQRPASTRVTSGLCRAIGERTGLDPLVVRIITIALTFAAGLGLALYVWGTLLTPRVGGQAPVRRLVPAFERWSTKTQLMVIVISTLVVVITAASTSRVPLGPAIIIISLVLLSRRRGNRTVRENGTTTAWAPPTAAPGQQLAEAPPVSVEEWRSRLGAHATVRNIPGDPLPVVDLYGPEEEPAATQRPEPAPVSWLGALAVVMLGAGAGIGAGVLGIGAHGMLMAMAVCTLTVGIAMVAWSLLIRSRRLPAILIPVVILGGAVTAGNAVGQATPYERSVAITSESSDLSYVFVADGKGLVDLSGLPLDSTATVSVDALASNVRILLPGVPLETTLNSDMSEITGVDPGRTSRGEEPPPTGITLTIDATMSKITLEYP